MGWGVLERQPVQSLPTPGSIQTRACHAQAASRLAAELPLGIKLDRLSLKPVLYWNSAGARVYWVDNEGAEEGGVQVSTSL